MFDAYNELKMTVLFAGLTKEEIERCFRMVRHRARSFKNNEMIFISHDNFFNEIGIILKGNVFIMRGGTDGDSRILHDLNEGDSFGESAAYRDTMPRDFYVVAGGACKILFIDARTLLNPSPLLADIHRKIMYNIAKMIYKKFVRANFRVLHMSKKTVRDKIISYLQEEHGEPRSFTCGGKINKTQLSDFLNVDRTALAKELTAMQREGLLTYSRHSITLKKHPYQTR
ncbi:MAG: Crp/Fnr family transcriptional regulator [Elusimicrobia bacterium]|nr:Crp/Fnr family transcriptional regulator [Elusimicrobiota bacterium]